MSLFADVIATENGSLDFLVVLRQVCGHGSIGFLCAPCKLQSQFDGPAVLANSIHVLVVSISPESVSLGARLEGARLLSTSPPCVQSLRGCGSFPAAPFRDFSARRSHSAVSSSSHFDHL